MDALVSSYPLPPSYYNLYTDEALQNQTAPLPPKPIEYGETYTVFGAEYKNDICFNVNLKDQGVEILYDENDHPKESMKYLFQRLHYQLISYLDDIHMNEENLLKKVDETRLILINMYHLMNCHRLEQAKQKVYDMMQSQINIIKEVEIKEVENWKKRLVDEKAQLIQSLREVLN
ncbi:Mediator complex, subunit Med7 domain-containing protein [Rozella allomycis CSF55]|uniref:Mediator of RNA polymerase II transcription subunit 7 n=1 Tax=Rozella allomycis (strain CSF55) TaxID=988480 RepID=A0A075B0Y4_ROZAC|nr:Mediator complex, subunit Med7 domain-containing protein [Rozella allomycis CSF55]|eukprot:EPZ36229.1 Mediator complex, subunit Med7 domain-containing protein [Rozella allomycis CSF55]